MKKIFFALVAIFGLWSCVQEDLPPVGPTIVDSEGGYVDVTFGVSLPDMKEVTRSMTSPKITSLHLLVFNEQGMLCDKRNATPCKENGSTTDEDGNEIPTDDMWGETSALSYFKVQLARTGMPRTIHLIANSPTEFDKYPVSSETSVITSLSVSGGQEAYWQRLEFPEGITGTPVLDADGNQLVDEDGPHFKPSEAVKSKLTAVPMIRNYSRIEVVNASSGDTALTDVEFVLVNIPDCGSVAPYNINMGQFEAMDDSTNYDKLVSDEDNHQPYTGYEPAGRQLMNNTFDGSGALVDAYNSVITPTTATVGTIDADGTFSRITDPNYLYLYERNQTLDTDNQTYVIVKGKYAGTANAQYTYYKIAIASEDENGIHSYNLLRNIQYTIVITGAVGEGFLTAEAAYGAGASNLLNYDVTTKNLTQISDGTKSLYVEYTQKVITADKAKVTLRYKYETSLSEDKLTTDSVKIAKLPYSVSEVITGSINEGDDTTDSDGWNTLSFTAGTTPSAGSTGYSQKIKLEIAGLVREVEYILSSRYYLQLQMPEKVGSDINSLVAAKLLLQKDLPRGIFPLEFVVVAENNSLSPLNFGNNLQLSTVTNVNADGTPGGNNFGYSVTLDRLRYEAMVKDLDEDDQYVTIPLYFVTNMADAALAIGERGENTNQKDAENNGTKVRVYNPYFEPDFSQFWIDKLYGLSLAATPSDSTTATASFKINTSNQSITLLDGEYFDFDILSEHKLTGVTNSNGVAVSGASIENGGKTLRINKAAYDAARNYTLTFSSAPNNIIDTTIIISNAEFGTALATVERYAVSWSIVGNNNDNNQSTMESGTQYRLRIVLPAGISEAVINTLKITATTTRTTLSLNGQSIDNNSTKTIDIDSTMYNSSTGYIYVPITASTVSDGSGARSFTLTLDGGDMFDLPGTMTRTYQPGGWFSNAGYQ